MGRTFIRQDAQIRESVTYTDSRSPSLANYETNASDLEYDLNSIRSQLQNFLNRNGASFPTDNWYDDITQPTTLENGTIRGIDAINGALHVVEKKRVLRDVAKVGTDVSVPATQNFVVLGAGELPSNTTGAIGAVTTLGTVVAYHTGTFGTHSLDEVAGTNALSPKNLMPIVDADTGDPILSSGRQVWGLFQSESNTDGFTMTGTTPTRVQISFVRPNSTFDDLEACPVADIESTDINYTSRERVRLEDLNEQDFLKGAVIDTPASASVTRQSAYDGQGTTPVDLTTNATLDLEGAGLVWAIRDDAEATLFSITEGSSGSTSTVTVAADVDNFDVDAVDNDFLNGASFDTGAAGTTINVGVTANQIDSGGALTVASGGSADLTLNASNEFSFIDTNKSGSTYSGNLKLSDSSGEWDNYETEFGEVSLLNAIVQAKTTASRVKGYATLQNNVAADTDVDATTSGNLDVDLPDYSGVSSFVTDCDVYLNGELLRNGADAAANHDVYPGTTPSQGMLKFEFALLGTGSKPDQLCMIVWGG